jgi:predicted nucleic acid-binding protein
VATFCIVEGHQLLHHDRDFDAFETHLGLRVLHPRVIPLN